MIARHPAERFGRGRKTICGIMVLIGLAPFDAAQTAPYERTYPQSRAAVEKALQALESSRAGRLPTLDGFADPGDRPLDNFQRGYYQCTVQVGSAPSGGSLVRISAKLTAWYADPNGSKSGYQMLPSNGRIETDFLDRLQEALGKAAGANRAATNSVAQPAAAGPPMPIVSDASPTASSAPLRSELSASSKASAGDSSPFKLDPNPSENPPTRTTPTDPHTEELNQEAKNLEEILRNQSHPNNLVAVKQTGTPVLMNPSESGKVLFLTSTQDEFELLDMNATWVHVRISGISRGWLRRSSVEMPDALAAASQTKPAPAVAPAPPASANKAPFQVENEEIASFPGSWEPLRGKTVKIISVQEAEGKTNETNSQAKLEFAKSLFTREYAELTRGTSTAAGVVVVFDAEDGGMMATTLPVLQQWKSGTLSEQAMWHRCYFDPPEMFSSSATR
jgi:hypothetical protein